MSQGIITKHALINIGCSAKEASVFLVLLEKGAMTATELGRALAMPRTSALVILESLKEKGFAVRIKVGGHFEWEAGDLDDLEASADERYSSFRDSLPALRELAKAQTFGKKFAVRILNGATGLMKAYYRLLDIPKGERIYIFEGKSSILAKLNIKEENVIKWQDAFKQSGIVMEVIYSEHTLAEIRDKKSKKFWQTHVGRLIIGYALPNAVMDFPSDIAVLPNTIILFIPKQETAIIIDSTELAESLRKLFEGLKLLGKKVDLNAEFVEIVEG